ncbi:MAG TPA: lysyl oxidase family protein [Casimicrobiaceae bacterium]|nr:lysyl oxidase family protein [Casimicrobiaceae bacterium]
MIAKSRQTLLRSAFGIVCVAMLGANSSSRAGAPLYPDIVEQISHLQIQNEHKREMLRFSTTHINIGDGPLQVRGGGQIAPCFVDGVAYAQCTHSTQEVLDADGNIVLTHPAGVAVFHPDHNHWHQSSVAQFQIRLGALDGPVWSAGTKITFCLVDNDQTVLVKKGSSRGYFECNAELQGISVGWGDNYHQSTEGQELDITGAPEGVYFLTHLADPDNHWLETDEFNNFAWVKFHLGRRGANPKVTILEQSTCSAVTCGSRSNP